VGEGAIWESFLPSQPVSTDSSFIRNYAIIGYSVVGGGGYAFGVLEPGMRAPVDPPSVPTYQVSSPIGSINPSNGGPLTTTDDIMEAVSPGNYTLFITELNGPGYGIAHVFMGYSSVTFVLSRPFFYYGITSLAIAAVYAIVRLLIFPRKTKSEKPLADVRKLGQLSVLYH
jgi:hypothetical protein